MNLITVTFDPAMWQLVPKEPTAEMEAAFEYAWSQRCIYATTYWQKLLAAAPAHQQAAMDERAQFERAYAHAELEQTPSGIYMDSIVRCMWGAWQARASLGHELTGAGE